MEKCDILKLTSHSQITEFFLITDQITNGTKIKSKEINNDTLIYETELKQPAIFFPLRDDQYANSAIKYTLKKKETQGKVYC